MKAESNTNNGPRVVTCEECVHWDQKSGLSARLCSVWFQITTRREYCSRAKGREMMDAKKVIKGLETCIATSDSACPDDCPYYGSCWDSSKGVELLYYSLMKDALEVIKAEGGKDITHDKETAITHLQIISTWAGFALEKDMNFFTKKHLQDIEAWTKDAMELLKEQEALKPKLESNLAGNKVWY